MFISFNINNSRRLILIIYQKIAFFSKVSEMHALETSRILTEEYSAKILLATMGKPKSAFELSEKLGVPIAACYRKIKILEDSGMINCVERRLTQAGKRISLYKSNVKNAQILFERNKIRANIEMIDGTSQNSTFDIDMSAFMEMSKPLA
jgi:predicted transcriptional regulator